LRFSELSRSYFRQGRARFRTAKLAYNQRNYPYCVRQAQEAVELVLKAALKLIGVEHLKFHDVSDVLQSNVHRFPKSFQKHADWVAKISKDLARKRAPAMYGEEMRGLPPEKLFDRDDAKKALDDAKKVLDACKNLFASPF